MSMLTILWGLEAFLVALVLYHHAIYPRLLALLVRNRSLPAREHALPENEEAYSPVSILVPAYREARYIADKIRDLAKIDYPKNKLEITILCDGSPDGTPDIARATLAELDETAPRIIVKVFAENRGKVALLNAAIAQAQGEIVLLMDASSGSMPDLVRQIAAAFLDPSIGVVCPGYQLAQSGMTGEAAYWRYQTRIKQAEAALAAPMGAHGAAYAFRRSLWQPLPDETINDDFVLPMQIVAKGAQAVYRPDLAIVERETTLPQQDFRRRRRIGAGNIQQAWLCRGLVDASRPALAFVFLSSKVLRALMPFILGALLLVSIALALVEPDMIGIVPLAAQGVLYGAALLGILLPALQKSRLVAYPFYFAQGYLAAFLGMIALLRGRHHDDRRVLNAPVIHVDATTERLKRLFDILVASLALAVFLLLLPILAILIKLDSKGPVFYRQLRVGRALPDRTDLFYLIKLRTMRVDAEVGTGAVWAAKGDPRVTKLGRFMRKTRLDELPQALNVLMGDMSIVGPRPERPVFFTKLESAVPFYAERTYGLKPGVTGLAQVSTGYDATIDDVRLKVLFDHTYALRIGSPLEWLKTDLAIVFKTVAVMGLGMGR